MTECFCFLFGLIIGIGAMIFFKRWVMSQPSGRAAYFKVLHDNFPVEFHACCPDMMSELFEKVMASEQETPNTPD